MYRGESKTVQRGNVTATAWKDNKVVTVMSTTTQPTAVGSVLRRQRDGSRLSVPCPESVLTYNKYMGGVDRGDQLRGYYNCRVKSRKFYKYIYFLFDVSITKCFHTVQKLLLFTNVQQPKEVPLTVGTGVDWGLLFTSSSWVRRWRYTSSCITALSSQD